MGKLITMSNDAITEFRRKQLTDGYTFPLTSTFAGMDEDDVGDARVRRISSLDSAVLESLPNEVQATVWAGMDAMRKFQNEAKSRGEPTNLKEMMANNREIITAASEWCIAAFIQPKLVKTEAELTPGAWLVDRVHEEDRVNIFLMCMDNDSDAMKKLRLFRPERRSDAEDDAAGGTPEPAIRSLGVVESGVFATSEA